MWYDEIEIIPQETDVYIKLCPGDFWTTDFVLRAENLFNKIVFKRVIDCVTQVPVVAFY